MRLGIPELIVLVTIFLAPIIGALYWILSSRHKRLGYRSWREYLRAVPRTDAERRDAVDLALKGFVFCMLGLLFSPFVLVGVVPLFYGGRKLVYAALGLGLVDDGIAPRA